MISGWREDFGIGIANGYKKVVSARRTNSTEFTVPRIITLGGKEAESRYVIIVVMGGIFADRWRRLGDHTTTLPALRSTFTHFGAVSVIHFDSQ